MGMTSHLRLVKIKNRRNNILRFFYYHPYFLQKANATMETNRIAIRANLNKHPPFAYVDVNSEYNVHTKRKAKIYAPICAA